MGGVARVTAIVALLAGLPVTARADVITDWNEKALPIVARYSLGPPAYRDLAMMNLAMFLCVNSIEPRFLPYKAKLDAVPTTSRDVAAAVAAAGVLSKLHPDIHTKLDAELKHYLAQIPDGPAKDQGVALGQVAAVSIVTLRANDGADAPDRYIPTASLVTHAYATVTPFALKSSSQFRPGPPIALTSREWADNYNEVRRSAERTARCAPHSRRRPAASGSPRARARSCRSPSSSRRRRILG
jgi:hypothetical protein